jgi:alkylhydroperoxidase family enzyme
MLGLSVGLTKDEMAAMADSESCASFDERDRLVLRYAEVLTRENEVDDALYAELAARFARDELVDLALTVGFAALVNRVHATFRTDLDDETREAVGDAEACMLPPRRTS